jgi:hypothetical protein
MHSYFSHPTWKKLLIFSIPSVLFFLAVYLHFEIFGVIGGFALGGLSIIIGLIVWIFKSHTKIYPWLLLGGFSAFIAFGLLKPIHKQQKAITDQRAERIISSLEEYKSTHGFYPDSLNELAPEYLEKIPSTAFGLLGGKFNYFKKSADHFGIGFDATFFMDYTYSSKSKKWVAHD